MSRVVASALLLLTLASSSAVVVLTDATLSEFVETHSHVLVEFYAPWCGHCKALAPEYEKAAKALEGFSPKIVLAKVDATEEKKSAEKFGIQGFPTLKWFVNGKVSDYNGGREEATIVSWLKKKSGPSTTTLSSTKQLEEAKASNEVLAVGVFKTEAEMKAFAEAASSDDDVPYYSAIDVSDVAAELGGEGVYVLKSFDEEKAKFEGDSNDAEAVKSFVSAESLPLVVEFSQKTAQRIFGGNVKQQLLVFGDRSSKADFDALIEASKPVAKKHKGDLLFVSIDKSDDRVLEYFGVKGSSDLPTFRGVKITEGGMKKYKSSTFKEGSDKVTTEALDSFVSDLVAGRLSPDLKSEEIPSEQSGPVTVLVGKSFDSIVSAPGKNVFVEFYAPWCGHCKKLAPIWDELGEFFKGDDSVVIAKMDATANEVESVQIGGFPTLKFYPAGSSEAVDYSGARELEPLKKFVNENKK